MRSLTIFAASLALGAAFAQVTLAQNKGGGGGIPSPLKLTVSGYSDGGDIPAKYTCAAKPPGGSPQIDWSGAPAGTATFALILSPNKLRMANLAHRGASPVTYRRRSETRSPRAGFVTPLPGGSGTPPGRHDDRPARSSLDWDRRKPRPRKRGPELSH